MHETLPMKLLLVFVRSFVCLCCLGIGETPFGKERHKQSKQPRKRTRKPLQVSISKTPVTPKSDLEEPGRIKDIVFFLFACWLLSFFPFTSLITNLLIPLVILCFFNYPLRLFTAEDDSTNGEVSSLFSGNINTTLGRALSHYLHINCKLIQVIP